MKAIQFTEYGGPEVLKMVELDRPKPGPHEVLIEIHVVGVNYADTARREGNMLYQPSSLLYQEQKLPGL